MSDLDENLTSILSSFIDTDAIDTPHVSELTDSAAFSSQLRFDHLDSCITGNDASLHQSSDENVCLLESHLTELSHADTASIVESTTENLDVTPFDLDKSLLEPGESVFIPGELPVINKVIESSNLIDLHGSDIAAASTQLALDPIESDTPMSGCDVQNSFLNSLNEIQSNDGAVEPFQRTEGALNVESIQENTTNAFDEETNSQRELHVEMHADVGQLNANGNVTEEVQSGVETAETIVADEVIKNALNELNSRHGSKKRRRILLYNDGESENSELEEERLPKPTSPALSDVHEEQGDDESSQANCMPEEEYEDFADEDDYIRDPNEKPGPKSKKQSTHLYNALKAKALLESAIVIPARKKKKWVIDSDDEGSDSALHLPAVSVDDIGLIPDDSQLVPFNLSTEPEDTNENMMENVEIEPKPRVQSNGRAKRETDSLIIAQSLSRAAIKAKMEKYHANNNRHSQSKKEPKDYFGMPLNAPYVDTSSDEDYFPTNNNSNKKHPENRTHQRNKNGNTSSSRQRRNKGHIPDDVYFNAKVPLHVLYSYDASSSDDEIKDYKASPPHAPKSFFHPTNRLLNKMPRVHKIDSKQLCTKSGRKVAQPMRTSQQTPAKPTVFQQLDTLKRYLRTTGIKVNVNDILKGIKTFQERCDKIREILQSHGIEGEPTLAKCKKLKKKLKLKEEIAGLDPNVIIDSNEEDGRPKRSTRKATRRNYVYSTQDTNSAQTIEIKSEPSMLLQKIKQVIDSDPECEDDGKNSSLVISADMVEAIIKPDTLDAIPEMSEATGGTLYSPVQIETPIEVKMEGISPASSHTVLEQL